LESQVLRDDGVEAAAATSSSAAIRHAAPGADAPQALGYEHAVVVVERHDVRDRAERDEIEQVAGFAAAPAAAPRVRAAGASARP